MIFFKGVNVRAADCVVIQLCAVREMKSPEFFLSLILIFFQLNSISGRFCVYETNCFLVWNFWSCRHLRV
jgi:hypothetical protein